MKIDWFTVIAQVINFFILVWLLRRFLYKPILKAVDAREKKIADQLKEAKKDKNEAKKEQDEFAKKNDDFDQQKKDLMDKAIAETKEARLRLLEEARNDANTLSAKLNEASKTAQENLNHEIAQKTQLEVFAIARKTLADLASVSLEEQVVTIFIRHLSELKPEEKKKFISAFAVDTGTISVRSAFDLPDKQQTVFKDAMKEILGNKIHVDFDTSPDLIGGIELTANGYKLSWSIAEYLHSLQKDIAEMIQAKSKYDDSDAPEKKKETKTQKETETIKAPDKKEHAGKGAK